jgi:putative cardiolipin synthase
MVIAPGCAPLTPLTLPPETASVPATTGLWSELSGVRPGDWFTLLNSGEEALDWRLRCMDSASRSLDLQTFLWKADPTGLRILRHLYDAADRGVRVRLLLDDTFTAMEEPEIVAIDRHPNIDVRIYNPFSRRFSNLALRQLMNLGEFYRLDHRMHNKTLIVDNQAAIIGGRNLADEYFGNHPSANFRDMEVLCAGPLVQVISGRFDDYWNCGWSFPADQLIRRPPSEDIAPDRLPERSEGRGFQESLKDRHAAWRMAAASAASGKASLIYDEPAGEDPGAETEQPNQLAERLLRLLEQVDTELIIVTAYLVPTPAIEKAIERAEDKGVQVRILTNSLRSNNHLVAHSAYRSHIRRLIGHGADLHEVRAQAKDRRLYMQAPVEGKELGLHAKLLVIDDSHVFIGSANLDPRSLRLNTEIGVLIESRGFNSRVRETLAVDFHLRNAWRLETRDDGRIIWVADDTVLDAQPADSAFQRLEDWFFGMLPIEGEM